MLTRLKTLGILWCLSILLGGCGHSGQLTPRGTVAEAGAPSTVPERYVTCKELAALPTPKGGWTKRQAIKALASVRASEIEKADCLHDLAQWTEGQLRLIRGD